MLRRKGNWEGFIATTVIVATLGLLFWWLRFADGLAHLSFDLPFAFSNPPRPDEVLIVFMDDKSRGRLHQPVNNERWDRALHTRLLRELTARGSLAVAFDVLFDDPSETAAVDEEFAESIRENGRVILGANCQNEVGDGGLIIDTLTAAIPELAEAAACPWAVANMPKDSDGTIRRHFYDRVYTNLAWQTAAVVGMAPSKRAEERWMNYYGPAGTIESVSYCDALDPDATAPGAFSNKVVFIGMAPIIDYQGSGRLDVYRTPYTRWTGVESTGVELHATAYANLVRRDWLRRVPPLAELGIFLLAAILLGALVHLQRMGLAFTAILGVALAAMCLGIAMAVFAHWWFNWMIISSVQVPGAVVALFVSTIVATQRQRSPQSVTPPAAIPSAPLSPMIPDHEMLQPFGSGSYGQVWLARNVLGSYRAVKIVRRDAFEDTGPFDREFRGIQAFEPVSRSHEGFVHILQVGRREDAGYFYSVMELADDRLTGQAIRPEQYAPKTIGSELSSRGKLSCDECVEIGLQLTDALRVLHEAGLVHRDIKPSNIIFVKGKPKLADIGLVAATSDAKSFVGTQGFLAPEGPGAPPADIYSLGKVLYEMAMGRDRCRFPELPTTLAEDPDCDKLLALNEILIKACENDVASRYSSAAALHADLKKLSEQFQS